MKTQDDTNKLHIYSASAGAGKTTTIAREYIRLALSYPNNYKHIQAVTFTNKATEEMKQRILEELYKISRGEAKRESDKEYWSRLCDNLSQTIGKPITLEDLKERAAVCLRNILMNYSNFRISTIDAFFQEILRSFARELNLPGAFRIELESDRILQEACHAVLVDQQYSSNSPILKWITEISYDKLKKGKSHNPMSVIEDLSKELLRDEVRAVYAPKYDTDSTEQQGFPSIASVERLKQHIKGYQAKYLEILKGFADEVLRLIQPTEEAGIALSYGTSGGLGVFYKIKALSGPEDPDMADIDWLPKRLLAAQDDPNRLYTKDTRAQVATLVDLWAIKDVIDQYIAFIEGGETRVFLGTFEIEDRISSLGLLSAIDTKVKEIQKNSNSLLLANAPSLIKNILDDEGGVPFLYERIGTQIKHYMIDEFQDTSAMQYSNFEPLLEESLAQGSTRYQDSIIVGDAKQSIYRWRGSDSSLLSSIKSDPQWNSQWHTLDTNWRSAPQIIHFNNALYKQLSSSIGTHFRNILEAVSPNEEQRQTLTPLINIFEQTYNDVEQRPQHDKPGHVCIHRFAYEKINDPESLEDDNPDDSTIGALLPPEARLLHQLPEQIRHIIKRGYRRGDIAILVRTNKEASYIAQLLLAAEGDSNGDTSDFAFISEEALAPTEALAVNFTISALHYIIEPESAKCREELIALHLELAQREPTDDELEQLCNSGRKSLYETLELIIARYKAFFSPGEYPHLVKLLDVALSFQQDLSLDIADFITMWQERGSSERLSMAKDKDKIQIMTIHKSKGLDFPIVLLPCLSWELLPKKGSFAAALWCDNPFAHQTGISKVPIKTKQKLLNTCFATDYLKECILASLDSLNMLYVATTRAKDEMHLWLADTAYPTEKLLNELKIGNKRYYHETIAGLLIEELYSGLSPAPALEYCTSLQCGERDTYDYVPDLSQESDDEGEAPILIDKLESYDIAGRIEELKDGLRHFDQERRRHYGNLMHHILSHIERAEDQERALQLALNNGELSLEDVPDVRKRLEVLLSCPKAKAWFDGSGMVLNESAILGATTVSRPDRVISYGDMDLAVIVDYKFGKPSPRYHKQIERYAQLLKSMGYKRVEGYLWYLSPKVEDEQLFTGMYEEPQLICTL